MARNLPERARAALMAIAGAAALALGVTVLVLAPGADRLPPGGRLVPVMGVAVGWGFAGLGIFAWWRRPDNGTGALMTAFGLSVLVSLLVIADAPGLFLLASPGDSLALAVFVHLLLAFPAGRVEERAGRVVVAAAYANAVVPQILALFLAEPAGDPGCAGCPPNPLLVASREELVEATLAVQDAAGVALALAAVALAVRRARALGPQQRRALAPLALAGAVLLGLAVVSIAAQALDVDPDVQRAAQLVFVAGFAVLPVAFLAGLARSRFFRGAAVSGVVERLAHGAGTQEALASALGDPSVVVAYWLEDRAGYVDREGRPFALPPAGGDRVVTEIAHRGRRVGALVHAAALREDAELMRSAADAAGLALENDRLEVELRARVVALRESRARIVEVGDAERRRLGRDLHDGAQQRLVSLLIDLQLARERWDAQPGAARELVDRAVEEARAAVEELRDLAAGIHPAVLTQRGLGAALESLASRAAVPVELRLALDGRLPAPVETAAYFLVAEGLTNVAKYAGATHARVRVAQDGDELLVEVADDGRGGADAARGTGLRGLADRVGALDGTLELESPPGRGTFLRARVPLPR